MTFFDEAKLQENFDALMDAVIKARTSALKGQYLKSVTLATTRTGIFFVVGDSNCAIIGSWVINEQSRIRKTERVFVIIF